MTLVRLSLLTFDIRDTGICLQPVLEVQTCGLECLTGVKRMPEQVMVFGEFNVALETCVAIGSSLGHDQ